MLGGLFYCETVCAMTEMKNPGYCYRKLHVTVPLLSGAEARPCLQVMFVKFWAAKGGFTVMGSDKCPWQAPWLSQHPHCSSIFGLQLSHREPAQMHLGWSPKTLGAKVSTGRTISSVWSLNPASWSFPSADTSLSEIDTVSAWQGCTGELLWKLKCHKVLKESVWIFSMNHMEIIVEEKWVCDRGLCLALFFMPVGLHILLTVPTLRVVYARICILRCLGVNLLHPFFWSV